MKLYYTAVVCACVFVVIGLTVAQQQQQYEEVEQVEQEESDEQSPLFRQPGNIQVEDDSLYAQQSERRRRQAYENINVDVVSGKFEKSRHTLCMVDKLHALLAQTTAAAAAEGLAAATVATMAAAAVATTRTAATTVADTRRQTSTSSVTAIS